MTTWQKRIAIALVIVAVVATIIITEQNRAEDPWYPSFDDMQADYVTLSVARKKAYEQALACSGVTTPVLAFDDINWAIIPGRLLTVEAVDGSIKLAGFFNPTDSTIYIPYTKRSVNWILVHESLHAIGIIGHPETPFRFPCYALPEQNY
jgi:hypothetical protein